MPVEDDAGINLTPMIDIVFIMLIFFIVTASFIKESGITVDLPAARTATVQEHAALIGAGDHAGAAARFEAVLAGAALPAAVVEQVRYKLAQLYLHEARCNEALKWGEFGLSMDEAPSRDQYAFVKGNYSRAFWSSATKPNWSLSIA